VKLHDLKPAPGSRKAKRRVGRGIAAGQGKTAGRGTKGQKARAGGSIPAWFEGGQTPLHQRIPKLRGFVNKFKIEYEVVNVGDIARLVELGELEAGDMPGTKPAKGKAAPVTVNQEILRAAGLVRKLDRPMKVLGGGELSAPLFVVADAFTASARSKIEAAGGTVSVLEVPTVVRDAIGVTRQTAKKGKNFYKLDVPNDGTAKLKVTISALEDPESSETSPLEAAAESVRRRPPRVVGTPGETADRDDESDAEDSNSSGDAVTGTAEPTESDATAAEAPKPAKQKTRKPRAAKSDAADTDTSKTDSADTADTDSSETDA
jgi:large subunit ribosomal protein L15